MGGTRFARPTLRLESHISATAHRSGIPLKKVLLNSLKIGLSLAIMGYLFYQAQRNDQFSDLWTRSKRWDLLALALAASFAATFITLVRWHYLVRALGIPITLRESVRLGFLGYFFNLAPLGIVGGDLLKAVMLAHRQPGHRPEAVASVFADRAIGLWVLFVVASSAILVTGFWRIPVPLVQLACKITFLLTVLGTVAGSLPFLPDLSRGRLTTWTHRIPGIGRPIAQLAGALRIYRFRLPALIGSMLATVAVHSLFAMSVYLIAAGLYDKHVHSLATHFVVSPLSSATSVVPLSMGPFEVVLNVLYYQVPIPGTVDLEKYKYQGLVVALGYRIITVLIAAVGLVYYLTSRREVAEMMHEVEELAEGENEPPLAAKVASGVSAAAET
jgi:hypothetical protein